MKTLVINKDIKDITGHINNAHIMEAVHILTNRKSGTLRVSAQIKISSYIDNNSFSEGLPRSNATDVYMADLQNHPDYQTALSVFLSGVMEKFGEGAVLNMIDIPQPPKPVTYEDTETETDTENLE
jgi:hypothetical protein